MDCNEIRKWYDILKNGEELVEIRCWGENKKVFSGYFTDADTLISEIQHYDNCATYFTLNTIAPACAARSQRNKMMYGCKATTSDADIQQRKWVLIDFDPKRPSDTNATDEEKAKAKKAARNVYGYLRGRGFPNPVFCDSGNGWHLLYRCDLLNDESSKDLISRFLQSLALLFNDGVIDIDTSVFNASRICKCYGTYSRKGADTPERPQRLSRIYQVPPTIEIVGRALFEKIADELPKKEKPTWQNNYGMDRFDIDEFIRKHGIEVAKELPFGNGGRKLVLKECPFDSNHKAPDSAIFVMPDGALGFKCFHNSCSLYRWSDLREKYEPKAFRTSYDTTRTIKPLKREENGQTEQETEPIGNQWLSFDEIKSIDCSQIVSIPSGFKGLDDLIIGFNKKEVTVWSGSNASGKSSILNTIMLNAAQNGYVSAIWSGELPPYKLKNWIMLAAAGKAYTKRSQFSKTANAFFVPDGEVKSKIITWLIGKVWVYNNDYGNKYFAIINAIRQKASETKLDSIVIDNLMALDIGESRDKWEQQKKFILDIVALAKELDVHIHLVCHPRKSVGFLRKTDISGTADLTNAVDNVFIVHRVNKDFERGINEFYGQGEFERYKHFGNVIEVCKNRDLGITDALVGLYYEVESKRFKDDENEDFNKYGWADKVPEPTIEGLDEYEEFGDMPTEFE